MQRAVSLNNPRHALDPLTAGDANSSTIGASTPWIYSSFGYQLNNIKTVLCRIMANHIFLAWLRHERRRESVKRVVPPNTTMHGGSQFWTHHTR